jgi:hypothetical protein
MRLTSVCFRSADQFSLSLTLSLLTCLRCGAFSHTTQCLELIDLLDEQECAAALSELVGVATAGGGCAPPSESILRAIYSTCASLLSHNRALLLPVIGSLARLPLSRELAVRLWQLFCSLLVHPW